MKLQSAEIENAHFTHVDDNANKTLFCAWISQTRPGRYFPLILQNETCRHVLKIT